MYHGLDTLIVLDDLEPGRTYTFHIKSTNLVGDSEYSDMFSFLMVDRPNKPLDLQVESFNDLQLVLKWALPLSNGGQPILGYRVYR